MSDKEQRRCAILTRFLAGSMTADQARDLLNVSTRHFRRLVAGFSAAGAEALVHGNRGRAPANRIGQEVRSSIKELAGKDGPYHDFNICHLHEHLAGRAIQVGRSTLDRIAKEEGIRKRRRGRPRGTCHRREPMPQEGMLLQIDGSPHQWLGRQQPAFCLMGAIDDATAGVVYGRFHQTETQEAYLLLMRTIAQEHGLPMSFYHDKHTILRSPKKPTIEDELAGRQPMSHLQAVMDRLGVESIAANTPQAKGRVERLWQTLQDRLTKEMRLAGVTSMEQANAFLPEFLKRFNARFSRQAAQPDTAWVSLEPDTDLNYLFAIVDERTLKDDSTLSFNGRTFQVLGPHRLAGKRIAVHQTPEANICLYHGRQRLDYKVVPARQKSAAAATNQTANKPQAKPAAKPSDYKAARGWLYGRSVGP